MRDHVVHFAAHPLSKRDIAEMTNDDLTRLNYEEMIDVVLASEMPVPNDERIRSFEGDTVRRLVRMAREYCRKAAT